MIDHGYSLASYDEILQVQWSSQDLFHQMSQTDKELNSPQNKEEKTSGQKAEPFQQFIGDPNDPIWQQIKGNQSNQSTDPLNRQSKNQAQCLRAYEIQPTPPDRPWNPEQREATASRAKDKREPYPTKNFLPIFKPCILKYLKGHLRSLVYSSHPLIARLLGKHGINLQDYEDLFREETFEKIWRTFFRERVHYRHLMAAGISSEKKKVYFSRIGIFEEAFRTKVFRKIN